MYVQMTTGEGIVEELVEVWLSRPLLDRLRAGLHCSAVRLNARDDGTFTMELSAPHGVARLYDFPVSGPDVEQFARG